LKEKESKEKSGVEEIERERGTGKTRARSQRRRIPKRVRV